MCTSLVEQCNGIWYIILKSTCHRSMFKNYNYCVNVGVIRKNNNTSVSNAIDLKHCMYRYEYDYSLYSGIFISKILILDICHLACCIFRLADWLGMISW